MQLQVHVVSTGHVTTQWAVTTVRVTMTGLGTTVRRVRETDLFSHSIIDPSALGFKNLELFLGKSKNAKQDLQGIHRNSIYKIMNILHLMYSKV